jgi:hypothetical protein
VRLDGKEEEESNCQAEEEGRQEEEIEALPGWGTFPQL